ncbi:MAG: TetR/AcrR family transcriptional regulator [Thermaerobacter sp.]|nr:TetR/AcrR family transcriptional regulator [Thermaerobacter sp.]
MSSSVDVLDIASQLFYQEGIQHVGMDRIRDATGVSLKALYRQFGSKEGLIEAYLLRRDERWLGWLAEHIRTQSVPRARLLAIFDALDEWFHGADFAGCAFIRAYAESPEGSAAQIAAANHKERLAALVRGEALAYDPARGEELAEQLLLLIEGAMVRAHVGRQPHAARTAKAAAAVLIEPWARDRQRPATTDEPTGRPGSREES